MYTIYAENVSEALGKGINHLLQAGIEEQSRNGPVLVAPTPVVTVYTQPKNRVLFSKIRDANPFFHLMEALWMLAGREDVAFPSMFAKNIAQYSDDGKRIHGAYGFRWRNWWDFDQIAALLDHLKKDPESRRAVLAMWSPAGDLAPLRVPMTKASYHTFGGIKSKDIPCNTHIYFSIRDTKLDMTVCNRSNDIIWGCYGANVVHMSVLQEYMATNLKLAVGVYRQFSNNFHAYLKTFDREKLSAMEADVWDGCDAYKDFKTEPYALMSIPPSYWDENLKVFMNGEEMSTVKGPVDPFFLHVVEPMARAWIAHKNKDYVRAFQELDGVQATDWRRACEEWMDRRKQKGIDNANTKED